jgi:hypothetical protein
MMALKKKLGSSIPAGLRKQNTAHDGIDGLTQTTATGRIQPQYYPHYARQQTHGLCMQSGGLHQHKNQANLHAATGV